MRYRTPTAVMAVCLLAGSVAVAGLPPEMESTDPSTGAENPDNVLPWAYFQALLDEEDALLVDVREDFVDHRGFLDHRDESHLHSTLRTQQWVDLEDASHQPGPAAATGVRVSPARGCVCRFEAATACGP